MTLRFKLRFQQLQLLLASLHSTPLQFQVVLGVLELLVQRGRSDVDGSGGGSWRGGTLKHLQLRAHKLDQVMEAFNLR